MTTNLVKLGQLIAEETGHYNGGPLRDFEVVGRDALQVLLANGLLPCHRVLDFGCGSLRIMYWLIRFLDSGNYYGLEPVQKGLQAGLKHLIGPDLEAIKKPTFHINSDSDIEAFGVPFDYILARSILTHTCPGMLRKILESFARVCCDGTFLASYWCLDGDVIMDTTKIGKNRVSVIGDELPDDDMRFVGYVKYSLSRIKEITVDYGLTVEEYRTFAPINSQIWLRFRKRGG